jgi:predicted MFS family arabinose efflux permease
MLLVFALTQANRVGWGSAQTIGVFAASAVLMAVFLWNETRSQSALVPLSIFKRRTLTGANVIGFGLGTMIFGMFFLLSLYMQQVLGFSAMETGFGYLAVALTVIVAATISQGLVTKLGVKPVLVAGMALLTVGLVYFTQVSVNGSYAVDLLPGFLIIGVGMGFSFVPISIAALAGVQGPEAGLASGLINTSQQIGGALGLALLTTVATTRTSNLAGDAAPTAGDLTSGFSLAFWVAAGFALVSLVTTIVVLRQRDIPAIGAEPAPVPAG